MTQTTVPQKAVSIANFAAQPQLEVFHNAIYLCNNQATQYVTQRTWCLSQARKKWEGCSRKDIRHKMMGMMEVKALILVRIGRCPAGLSVHLPLLSSPCTIKPRR